MLCVGWRRHVLIGSKGVRAKKKHEEDREGTINEESKETSTHVHTGTWYLELRRYLVLLSYVRNNAQRSRDSTAGHGTARHRTTLRCAAEL